MQVISNTLDFNLEYNSIVTIGKFDGVHIGHADIIGTMKKYRSKDLFTVVMTFDTPPQSILSGSATVLTTNAEKRMIFTEMDVDTLIEFPFYEKTASISAEDFIEDFIVGRMHAKKVVVGPDCSFGNRARGNVAMLKEYGERLGFEVIVVEKIKSKEREISSTYLRELCDMGNVAEIEKLSFAPYFITGIFEHGGGEGQRFGMPYCVMKADPVKHLPKSGVYYSRLLFDDFFYPSLTNVNRKKGTLETILFSGNRRIGSSTVSIALFDRLRDTIEFESEIMIKKQLADDILAGEKWHNEHRAKGN